MTGKLRILVKSCLPVRDKRSCAPAGIHILAGPDDSIEAMASWLVLDVRAAHHLLTKRLKSAIEPRIMIADKLNTSARL
jgi:hypothetical protein